MKFNIICTTTIPTMFLVLISYFFFFYFASFINFYLNSEWSLKKSYMSNISKNSKLNKHKQAKKIVNNIFAIKVINLFAIKF